MLIVKLFPMIGCTCVCAGLIRLLGIGFTCLILFAGARVRVECKDRSNLNVVYGVEGLTDETGTYKITVSGDHNDQLCEAILVSSPLPECATIEQGRERARVYPTVNNGIVSRTRYANNMGFLKDAPLAGCAQLLKQYQESD